VYNPAPAVRDDEVFYKYLLGGKKSRFRFRKNMDSRTLIVGTGTGLDALIAARQTEGEIWVTDINPLALANARALFRSAGLEHRLRTFLMDNVADVVGVPLIRIDHNGNPTIGTVGAVAQFDHVVWNMPSHKPAQKEREVMPVRNWDGAPPEVLRRFAAALPQILRPKGVALIWNVRRLDPLSKDEVDMAFQTAGHYLKKAPDERTREWANALSKPMSVHADYPGNTSYSEGVYVVTHHDKGLNGLINGLRKNIAHVFAYFTVGIFALSVPLIAEASPGAAASAPLFAPASLWETVSGIVTDPVSLVVFLFVSFVLFRVAKGMQNRLSAFWYQRTAPRRFGTYAVKRAEALVRHAESLPLWPALNLLSEAARWDKDWIVRRDALVTIAAKFKSLPEPQRLRAFKFLRDRLYQEPHVHVRMAVIEALTTSESLETLSNLEKIVITDYLSALLNTDLHPHLFNVVREANERLKKETQRISGKPEIEGIRRDAALAMTLLRKDGLIPIRRYLDTLAEEIPLPEPGSDLVDALLKQSGSDFSDLFLKILDQIEAFDKIVFEPETPDQVDDQLPRRFQAWAGSTADLLETFAGLLESQLKRKRSLVHELNQCRGFVFALSGLKEFLDPSLPVGEMDLSFLRSIASWETAAQSAPLKVEIDPETPTVTANQFLLFMALDLVIRSLTRNKANHETISLNISPLPSQQVRVEISQTALGETEKLDPREQAFLVRALEKMGGYFVESPTAGADGRMVTRFQIEFPMSGNAGPEGEPRAVLPPMGTASVLWDALAFKGPISLKTRAKWAWFVEEIAFAWLLPKVLAWGLASTGFLDPSLIQTFHVDQILSALAFGFSHDRLYKRDEFGNVYDAGPARWYHRLGFAALGAVFRIGFLLEWGSGWALPLAFLLHGLYNKKVASWLSLPLATAGGSRDELSRIRKWAEKLVTAEEDHVRRAYAKVLADHADRGTVVREVLDALHQLVPLEKWHTIPQILYTLHQFDEKLAQEVNRLKKYDFSSSTLPFRNNTSFTLLKYLFAGLAMQRISEGAKTITALSLGASTGDEAVSIAATLLKEVNAHPEWHELKGMKIEVHGYEIWRDLVEKARKQLRSGQYKASNEPESLRG
ncbi:MAG: hypothetical protein HY548_01360, partial [Elusimicrobia bacterium]|nr:hypothetical protein [Elusimicrobiota bacterium]